MRRTYRYDKNLGKMTEVTGKIFPVRRDGPYIIGDIEPYQAVGPDYGKVISSRSHHREYLRQHNLTEVGNEKKYIIGNKDE